MKLKVDLTKCTKSGECYYNHPRLVRQREDGFPEVIAEELVTGRQKIEAQQAVSACPIAEERPIFIEP